MSGRPRFTLYGEELPIVFTYHAKDRMKQFRLSAGIAYQQLCEAMHVKAPDHRYKEERYRGNFNIHYLQWGPYVYTGKNTLDRQTREPIFLILTVTDQRIMLR